MTAKTVARDSEPKTRIRPGHQAEKETVGPFSYRGFSNRHSLMLATGVALIVLGCALSTFATLLPAVDTADATVLAETLDEIARLASKELVHTNFSGSHALATVVLLSFVLVGGWLLGRARDDLKSFQEAYPYLEVAFTPQEQSHYRTCGHRLVVAGMMVLAAAIALGAATHAATNLYADLETVARVNQTSAIDTGTVLTLVAVALWLLLRGVTLKHVPNKLRYNFKALSRRNVYEMDREASDDAHDRLLAAREIVARKSLLNKAALIVGAIVSLCFYALPSLETPFFWLGIAAALIASRIISYVAFRRVSALFPELAEVPPQIARLS